MVAITNQTVFPHTSISFLFGKRKFQFHQLLRLARTDTCTKSLSTIRKCDSRMEHFVRDVYKRTRCLQIHPMDNKRACASLESVKPGTVKPAANSPSTVISLHLKPKNNRTWNFESSTWNFFLHRSMLLRSAKSNTLRRSSLR